MTVIFTLSKISPSLFLPIQAMTGFVLHVLGTELIRDCPYSAYNLATLFWGQNSLESQGKRMLEEDEMSAVVCFGIIITIIVTSLFEFYVAGLPAMGPLPSSSFNLL